MKIITGTEQNDIAQDHVPINNTRHPANKTAHKAVGWALASLAVLFILMQIVYLVFNRRSGYEYSYDWMFYAVNGAILVCAILSLIQFFPGKKPAILASAISFAVLLCINLFAMFSFGFQTTSIVSVSQDLIHKMILKQDVQTGKVTTYRNPIFVFARMYEQFPDTVNGPLKTQWLAPDVCAVTYMDTNNSQHQYVGTFGDRGNGISYYYVKDAIYGKWAMDAKNADGNTLTADESGIIIKSGDTKEFYDYKSCAQFGTLALVLYKNDLPQWTIALNSDCKIAEGFGILADGGTITLCQVSMDKTAPFTYFRTNNPLAGIVMETTPEPEPAQAESAGSTVNLVSDFSGLKKYGPKEVMVLNTASEDFFEIGKAALSADLSGFASFDTNLQITQIKVTAGDINDFLIEMQSSGSNNLGPMEYNMTYRIQKGNGVYGVAQIVSGNGMEGLNALDPPLTKDTSNDPSFRLFIPQTITEKPAEEVAQEELAAAQVMADLITHSPDLSDFESCQGLVKVKPDSTDLFMIARLAIEENIKTFAVNGFNNDVQITDMFLLAGDADEFLIYVKYTSKISAAGVGDQGDSYARYRIKKGDGVYIAMVSGYAAVGPAGLDPIEPPQFKDTSNDPAYHFFVPAK